MKTQIFLFLISAMLTISGCSPVRIYSDPALTNQTGLKFYSAKPYLHVEREPESNRIVKSVVIYLPDLSSPHYMSVKDGLGSSDVDVKFTDGTISTFGFASESKIPEYIEALATMISKGAGAVEDINSLKGSPGLKATANTIELYEIVITGDKTFLRPVKPSVE